MYCKNYSDPIPPLKKLLRHQRGEGKENLLLLVRLQLRARHTPTNINPVFYLISPPLNIPMRQGLLAGGQKFKNSLLMLPGSIDQYGICPLFLRSRVTLSGCPSPSPPSPGPSLWQGNDSFTCHVSLMGRVIDLKGEGYLPFSVLPETWCAAQL